MGSRQLEKTPAIPSSFTKEKRAWRDVAKQGENPFSCSQGRQAETAYVQELKHTWQRKQDKKMLT
jgi:hypothetical protein